MRTVKDSHGTRYELVKRSGEASLVRNIESGAKSYIPNTELTPIVDEGGLTDLAETTIAPSARHLITGVHSMRALGLLVLINHRGSVGVRELLDRTTYCERDLFRVLHDLDAGGLLEETTVDGERGYRVSNTCTDALELVRQS